MGMPKIVRAIAVCAVCIVFNQASAKEESIVKVRWKVDTEKFCVGRNGVFLRTRNAGDILLNNLQFDGKDYYTTCRVTCVCNNCHKEFTHRPAACDGCGYAGFNFAPASQTELGNCMTAEKLVCNCLETDPRLEALLCSGEIGGCRRYRQRWE